MSSPLRILCIFLILTNSKCHLLALTSSNTRTQQQSNRSTHTRLSHHKHIYFSGKSLHTIRLIGNQHAHAFPKWLASKRAHPHLLGTNNISQISEGLYKSVLPSISWFGIDIVPTFFQKVTLYENQEKDLVGDDDNDNDIDHSKSSLLQLNVSIEDSLIELIHPDTTTATTTINSSSSSFFSSTRLVQKIMEKCSFTGGNDMSCFRYNLDGTDHIELSSELTLRMVVPLSSRLMILPPGFHSIGNKLFQKEAEKRVKDSLLHLVEEYQSSILE